MDAKILRKLLPLLLVAVMVTSVQATSLLGEDLAGDIGDTLDDSGTIAEAAGDNINPWLTLAFKVIVVLALITAAVTIITYASKWFNPDTVMKKIK